MLYRDWYYNRSPYENCGVTKLGAIYFLKHALVCVGMEKQREAIKNGTRAKTSKNS